MDTNVVTEWKFTTSRPRVVSLEPASIRSSPLDPQIKLTFNQPMDAVSVESNFEFNGTEGKVKGDFTWNDDGTVLTFLPNKELERNVGYILKVGALAKSKGGMTLGEDYGAVLNTFDNFAVASTNAELQLGNSSAFSSPLSKGDYDNFIKVTPPLEYYSTGLTDDGLSLGVYGNFKPETNYSDRAGWQIKRSLGTIARRSVHLQLPHRARTRDVERERCIPPLLRLCVPMNRRYMRRLSTSKQQM